MNELLHNSEELSRYITDGETVCMNGWQLHVYTHTHTHTRGHTAHTHVHVYICMYALMDMHTCAHALNSYPHMQKYVHKCIAFLLKINATISECIPHFNAAIADIHGIRMVYIHGHTHVCTNMHTHKRALTENVKE